jgi:hypothetical protein
MHMAMLFMVVDTQDMLAMRVFTFPAFTGSPYFFDKFSFD